MEEQQLDEMLSSPSTALVEDMKKLDGDIMILGAGGKVGPSLSLMAAKAVKAAGVEKRVIAVSRFGDPLAAGLLSAHGVEMISADLSDPEQVKQLPRVKNIIYMLGRKFGTSGNACDTWMTNVAIPCWVTGHFGAARYVEFSTGNVYPLTDISHCGCTEEEPPSPVGEYAMSTLGRERIFEAAARNEGAEVVIFRLNYAVDLRYGVLSDIAMNVLNHNPVSVRTQAFNCVWQGYVNETAIRALTIASRHVEYLNVTGPEIVSVKATAEAFGKRFGICPIFQGEETQQALLSNAGKCFSLFGYPSVTLNRMIQWQADWISSGGRMLHKPTHFEERKGNF